MSPTTTYQLRPVSAMTRSSSPTASTSTASDRSPPPLGMPRPPSKTMLPPSTTNFSPIPTSARPRRPLSPSSIRGKSHQPSPPIQPTLTSRLADVDIPLDPERAFAARGKFPAPPTGHELMALFPPAPPLMAPGPTSGFFEREERKFFAQAGKEIVRLRLEVDTFARPAVGGAISGGSPLSGPGVTASPHPHVRAHSQPQAQPQPHSHTAHARPPHERLPPPAHNASVAGPAPPHSTSPRSRVSPNGGFAVPAPPHAAPPLSSPSGPAHPGYPITRPSEHDRAPGGGGDAMVVDEDDDDAWRRPTPHNARRRAGKHTRRVIVK